MFKFKLLAVFLLTSVLGKKELFCFDENTVDNVCHINNLKLKLRHNLVYETALDLVFNNSSLKCLTKKGHPCDVTFNVTGSKAKIEFNGNSTIIGR